ncbi:MAG: hypothetical protein FWF84_03860, partial [Kiritimatiellaeota bacterium]|nr:hypothetical protein [Kiritimatiellota bacterium]
MRKLAVAMMAGVAGAVFADTYLWTGAASGNWGDLGNWEVGNVTPGSLPGSGDDVVVDGADTLFVNQAFAVKSVTVAGTFEGIIYQNYDVTTSGDFSLLGGTWRYYGNDTVVYGGAATLDVGGDMTIGAGAVLECQYSSLTENDGQGAGRLFAVGGDLTVEAAVYTNAWTLVTPGYWEYTEHYFENGGSGYALVGGVWTEEEFEEDSWGYLRDWVADAYDWRPALAIPAGHISADGMGFGIRQGPGRPDPGAGAAGGSYGGAGGAWNTTSPGGGAPWPTACYGSIAEPVALGSGGVSDRAGGAIKMIVAGDTVVNGTISATGIGVWPTGQSGGGSAGSVWLITSTLSGSGEISASTFKSGNFGDGFGSGGGGRIAIELTGSDDFSMIDFVAGASNPTLTVRAQSVQGYSPGDSAGGHFAGGAGSIYLKGMSQARGDCYYKADTSIYKAFITAEMVAEVNDFHVIGNPSFTVNKTAWVEVSTGTLSVYGSIYLKDGGALLAGIGGTVELLGSAPATISSDGVNNVNKSMDFYNFKCVVPGKLIDIDGRLNIANDITIVGDGGDPITLTNSGNAYWYLNLTKPLPWYNIRFTEISWANASGSVQAVTVNDCIDGDNNVNIVFAHPAGTVTWTGAEDSDWYNDNNWDTLGVPSSLDDVVIAPTLSGNYPILDNAFMFNSLKVEGGAEMTVDATALTVNNAFTVAGTFITAGASATNTFSGDVTLTGGTISPMPGIVILNGLDDQTITVDGNHFNAVDVRNIDGTLFFADAFAATTLSAVSTAVLVFDDDVTVGTFAAAEAVTVTVGGDVTAGDISLGASSAMTVVGDVDATQIITGSSVSLDVGGDVETSTLSVGEMATVDIGGRLSCDGTLHNIGSLAVTADVSAERIVNIDASFTAGSVTCAFFESYRTGSITVGAGNSLVADYVILKGKAGETPLVIRSSDAGTAFSINAKTKAVCAVNLDIKDCNASLGKPFLTAFCVNSGNIAGFDFGMNAAWKYWTGTGADNFIANGDNWTPTGVPTEGEGAIIDYDLGSVPRNVEQYVTGIKVTHLIVGGGSKSDVLLRYADAIEVTGDCAILTDGFVTSSGYIEGYEFSVDMTVRGDLFINGRMDVVGKGYPPQKGPGAGGSVAALIPPDGNPPFAYGGGSHGGVGGQYTRPEYAPTYGSMTQPVTHGSGGFEFGGGGVIRLVCIGELHCFGTITATGNGASNNTGGGSGGSVWVTTGKLIGNGAISADGGLSRLGNPFGQGFCSGGGGRVAVELTKSDDFGDVAITANGHAGYDPNHSGSSPGSVFLRSPSNPLGTCTYDASTAYQYSRDIRITELVEDTTVGNFVVIGAGAINFHITNATLTVLGDWRSEGTGLNYLVDESGTVEFAGTGVSKIMGATRFSNLVAT